MSEPLVSMREVNVQLGGRQVLTDVCLDVFPGDQLALVGPNGAGKTTLLRSMLGLLRVQSGTVRIAGRSPRAARAQVGYVPQKHAVEWDFPITVLDTVLHGRTPLRRWYRPLTAADVTAGMRALTLVGLTGLEHRPIAELSGGQRQRVLIARALSLSPQLLLLDEPFTGVDAATQEALLNVLADQSARGVAVVMTTHDLPQMLEHSDRAVLVDGGIRQDSTAAEVALSPDIADVFGDATARRLRLLANAMNSSPTPITTHSVEESQRVAS